jgi:diguanylate cyclase (GGDEF)-like protein/PAS domain S-box-containing protein
MRWSSFKEKPGRRRSDDMTGNHNRVMADHTRTEIMDRSAFQESTCQSDGCSGADVLTAQTELIYTQAPVTLGSALAIAALMYFGLWGVADHTQLSLWFSLHLLQTMLRTFLVVRYRRAGIDGRRYSRWANLYLGGALVSGFIWGCLGLLINFSWPVEYTILSIMGLAGILAGAISSYAVSMPVYIAFMAPAILITAQSFLAQADQSSNEMGLLLIVFAGALLIIARNYNRSVVRALQLRGEKSDLLTRLTEANVLLNAEVRERQQVENELIRERELFTKGPVTVFRWRVDEDWSIEYASKAISQFGYQAEELVQQRTPYTALIHPNDLERVRQADFQISDKRFSNLGIDYRILRPDGEVRWVYDYSIPLRDENGVITHCAGYLLDITDRKRAEFELEQEKERAQITLQSIGDAVITTDVNGQVEFLNTVAERLTRWENTIARGLPLSRLLGHFDVSSREGIEKPVARALHTGVPLRSGRDWVLRRDDGTSLSVQYSISPLLGRDGAALGVVLVLHDVTENRSMAKQLSYQRTHDTLTGLINRREFESCLQVALESARKENGCHALCYLDMDQFKIVNDTCSHTAGDMLLKETAAILRSGMRETDVLARIGGDEFGLLLKNCMLEDALAITEDMLCSIRAIKDDRWGRMFGVSASIGIAMLDATTGSITEVMQWADLACYAAKDHGRNRIHIYRDGDQELARRHGEMKWVSRLTEAIEAERLVLYRQDIAPVEPHGGKRHHFEVLVRMLDESGQLVKPDRFLPAAERYNLVSVLDRWVISRSFDWYAAGFQDQVMSINLSGSSLANDAVLDFVKDELARHRVPPSSVCFEITETAAIANLDRAVRFITELKQLGCLFALDDFGSGLSSFSYLRNLPVDYLKIDGSFIRGLDTDPINAAMVNAIAQLGRAMGIETIAEFVENDAVLKRLAEIGVDYAQGYGINVPGPLDVEVNQERQRA